MQDEICKYNKTGFCKFKEDCRKTHNNIMYENPEVCMGETCTKRHPKDCTNFSKSGSCRPKEKCAYKHTQPIIYQAKLDEAMLMMILGHQQKISDLTKEVENLKLVVQSIEEANKNREKETIKEVIIENSVLVDNVEDIPSETMFIGQVKNVALLVEVIQSVKTWW